MVRGAVAITNYLTAPVT